MKKLLMLVPLLAAVAMITGCELSRDFVVTVQKEFTVNYNSTSIARTELIDGTTYSDDLEKYAADLKSVDVNRVTYTVTYFNGSNTQEITSAVLSVAPSAGSDFTTLASMSRVNLMSVAAIEKELEYDKAGEKVLEDGLLGDDHSFQLKFAGTANQAPLNFKIKFKIECKVKYEKKLI